MIKNYIVTALRNISRSKFYSFINIVGLSTGILAAILIILYVKDELGYDKFYKNHARIFRIESRFNIGGSEDIVAVTSPAIGPMLAQEFPQVERFVRLASFRNNELSYNGKKFEITQGYWVDTTFFDVFNQQFIAGDPTNALVQPNAVVLTESIANQMFGRSPAVGKTITTPDNQNFTVTAVIRDLPKNTHTKFDALFSLKTIENRAGSNRFNSLNAEAFFSINVYTFVLLRQPSDMDPILAKNDYIYQKYMASVGEKLNAKFRMEAQPLAELHFSKKELKADEPVGNPKLIILFALVALLILVIAAINYMNMATARSANRAKEVGIRKVLGAQRSRLVLQFLAESVIISLASLALAYLAAEAIIDPLNTLTGKNITRAELYQPLVLGLSFAVAIFIGLVSGSYPAGYLSSFNPIEVLKGKASTSSSKILLRKLLVVVQFTISVIMIIGTVVVSMQQSYIRNKNLGFDSNNLYVYRETDTTARKKTEFIRDQLLKTPYIEDFSSSVTPLGMGNDLRVYRVEQQAEGMKEFTIATYYVDFDFLHMMKIPILEGRQFEKGNASDSTKAYIINEAAANFFQWNKTALGRQIYIVNDIDANSNKIGQVIAVVKNFHFQSVHNVIEPFIIIVPNFPLPNMNVRIKPGKEKEAYTAIEKVRKEAGATTNINIFPYKERLNEDYAAEEKLGWLFRVFSLLTIFTSILGLMGLTSYLTEQRTKEISIRKVMGAESWSITKMLTLEYIKLVLLADLIAWPIAYIAATSWLQGYAYRINFSISPFHWQTLFPFLLATLVSLVIAIVTVGWLAKKAAETDPAFALKQE
jgi:ABC-type antimicrobial peptide transport system, permease component